MNLHKLIVKTKERYSYPNFYYETTVGRFLYNAEGKYGWFREYVKGIIAYSKLRYSIAKYEFDWTFIIKVLKFSLQRVKKSIIIDSMHANTWELDVRRIEVCEYLCDRIVRYDEDGDKSMQLLFAFLTKYMRGWWT